MSWLDEWERSKDEDDCDEWGPYYLVRYQEHEPPFKRLDIHGPYPIYDVAEVALKHGIWTSGGSDDLMIVRESELERGDSEV